MKSSFCIDLQRFMLIPTKFPLSPDYGDFGDGDWGWGAPMRKANGEINADGSYDTGKFGVNLGGGAQYDLTDHLMLNFEVKYSLVSDLDQCVISLGAAYKF